MIINYKSQEGEDGIAIVIKNCTTYEDIQCLQNALIKAIKCLALNNDECDKSEETWYIANLLKETFLTSEQMINVKI